MRQLAAMRSNLAAMAQMAAQGFAGSALALVTSYDPDHFAVKVTLQPPPAEGDAAETGWLPVWSPWIGNTWGLFSPPSIGDQVLVLFPGGDGQIGIVIGGIFSDVDKPLPAPAGEFWLKHKQGASLKFTNDGKVSVVAPAGLFVTGDTTITGKLHVTDDAQFDKTVTATTDVVGGGKHLKTHTHSGVTAGGGTSGPPS